MEPAGEGDAVKVTQALGWYYPESLGGTEVYVDALAHRLRENDVEVTVVAPDPGGKAARAYRHHQIEVWRYPTAAVPNRREAQGRQAVRGAELFHRWLAQERPDIVHFHTFVTGLGLDEVAAARDAGARVVVTTHSSSLGFLCQRGTLMQWGEVACDGVRTRPDCTACELHHRGLPRPLARLLSRLPSAGSRLLADLPGALGGALGMGAHIDHNRQRQARLAELVDRFVVLTEFARGALAATGFPPEKLELNRLGMSQRDVERKAGPAAAPTQRPIRLGYLGRLDPIKGVEELVRAAATLPRELDFELELCGPPAGEAPIRRRLRELAGGDRRIRFADPIPAQQAPERLARYDLLCCPSRCAEGGPTVAIEAHAVGTPVLGTDLGGLAELIRDGIDGRLVPPADVPALRRALHETLEEPHSTLDRWRAALPPARTLDQVTTDYLHLYRQVLP